MKRSGKTEKSPTDKQVKSRPDSAVKSGRVREAFRRRPINFFYVACFLALLFLGINLGILLGINDPQLRTILSDVISPVLDLSASVALIIAAKNSAIHSKRLAIAWGLIALAMFLYFLGDITWFILEVGLKVSPFPSLADGFYLAYFPVFMAGAFLLLDKPPTVGELIKRMLDMAIIVVSAMLGLWKFLIGPIINSTAGQSPLEKGISVAYPVGDLVLIAALFLIIHYPSKKQKIMPIYILVGSLLVTIITDSIYTYQSILGTYVSGGLLDLGWVMGSLLMFLAGISQWVAVRSTNIPGKIPFSEVFQARLKTFQPYVPYFWLVAAIILIGPPGVGSTAQSSDFYYLSLGLAEVVIFVIVRQVIAIYENNKLNSRLQDSLERVQTQTTELEKTNQELQNDIAERKKAEAARQESETLFRTLFELSPDAILLIDPHDPSGSWPIIDCNVAACQMNGYTRDEMIGQSIDELSLTPSTPEGNSAYLKQMREAGTRRLEAKHRRKNGTDFPVDIATTLIKIGGRELIVGIDHDITERVQAEEEIKHRLAELEAINKIATVLRSAHTLDKILPALLDTTLEVMHAAQGSIWLYDPIKDELDAMTTRGYDEQAGTSPLLPVKPGKGVAGRVFASGEPYVSGSFQLYPNLSKGTRQLIPPDIGGAAIPIRALENVIGTLIVNVPLPRELTPGDVRLLTTLSEIAGSTIRRVMLGQQTERRLQQLAALSEIDRAIISSVDLRLTLNSLLNQVMAQLGIDAADVLLFDPILRTLDYAAGSGFRTRAIEGAHLRLGEGYAGRAALERQILHIPNLAERDDNPRMTKALTEGEAFVSYFGVPLLAKGQIKGVLEIFHRVPLEHDTEWLDFLNTLAGQAAIAIDNVTLFDTLQRSNLDLAMAYDATIEGWSHALDLRDKETEGHTQRVTNMTVSLARTFGLSEEELKQVRWGALLHDIGKMGIPDKILLKPGPLTDEEWVIMKEHPLFAYEMLSPIEYLKSALNIPYLHHEKWDGTGYPLGLKGEQIPLAARIFAVVDVWDALRSDRPYRSAWPEKKVREHIRSSAGTHFDPQVVKAFLELEASESDERKKKET